MVRLPMPLMPPTVTPLALAAEPKNRAFVALETVTVVLEFNLTGAVM